MPPSIHEPIIGLPDFKIISYKGSKTIEIEVEYVGKRECPHCQGQRLPQERAAFTGFKDHSIGINKSILLMRTYKFQCYGCKRYFNQRFQGINLYQRVTEPFKEQVGLRHHQGTNKRVTAINLGVGEATVERYYHRHLTLQSNESKNASCPKILGIDENILPKNRVI
ncbi:MAG: transposase family protein [Bdellovibrionaceae bacterium]|nr:transposase family protein [Pseudobdellovibrionaceae bacterium]